MAAYGAESTMWPRAAAAPLASNLKVSAAELKLRNRDTSFDYLRMWYRATLLAGERNCPACILPNEGGGEANTRAH